MLGGLGAIPNEKASDFYQGIHSYLRESGFDGVKVDAQGAMGTFGEGAGGGPALVRWALCAPPLPTCNLQTATSHRA